MLYLLFLIKITILPIATVKVAWNKEVSYMSIQFIPFKSIYELVKSKNLIQIFGNIILLMPLPLLLQGVNNKRYSKINYIKIILLTSIGIELSQLIINILTKIRNHVIDIDDIFLNILGGVILVVFYKPINNIIVRIICKVIPKQKKNC